MTKDEALKEVEKIRELADNAEDAHQLEDFFRRDFIAFIAQRDDELGEIARIVLSTDEISFARWCA